MKNIKDYILLHVIIFIFGYTGIIGKALTIPAMHIVWYRMLIAAICLFAILFFYRKKTIDLNVRKVFTYLGIGVLVAIHWFAFYHAIDISTVSITLATLSSASLFTAFLEPLITKRKIRWYEVILGLSVIVGLIFIFSYSLSFWQGILVALLSAFFASLFTVINAQVTKKENPVTLSAFEMLGGFIAISIYLFFNGDFEASFFQLSRQDWVLIILLATLATTFAFLGSVYVMKRISAFTVSLSINLEPVYGIVLALIYWPETEKMESGFYIGTAIILASLVLNAYFKRKFE